MKTYACNFSLFKYQQRRKVFLEKLKYIHENPVRAGICMWPDEYKYSSALFYKFGKDNWGFLTHLQD